MSDITMCKGGDCPVKTRDTCYRFTAPANPYRQSYFMHSPVDVNGCCNEYIEDTRKLKSAEVLK